MEFRLSTGKKANSAVKTLIVMMVILTMSFVLTSCNKTNDSSDVPDELYDESVLDDTVNAEEDSEEIVINTQEADNTDIAAADNAEIIAADGAETLPSKTTTTFTLTGENFKFLMDGKEAPELKVKVGDTVRIEFTSTSGFHDWVVDEFNAATEKVKDGESTSVEFVADKAGTFEYYCSVGSHRDMGMKGNLVVE